MLRLPPISYQRGNPARTKSRQIGAPDLLPATGYKAPAFGVRPQTKWLFQSGVTAGFINQRPVTLQGGLNGQRTLARACCAGMGTALARFFNQEGSKTMHDTNGGYMPMDQVRLLLIQERRELQRLRRREQFICFGSILIMGAALLGCCWGVWG